MASRVVYAALAVALLGGCIKRMPNAEIDTAAKQCVAHGGSPDFVHAGRGRGPVIRVDCWGAA